MNKELALREAAMETVATAGEKEASVIQNGITKLLGDYLQKGEKLPDTALLVLLITRALRDRQAKLAAAAQSKTAAVGAAGGAQHESDDARAQTFSAVSGCRNAVADVFGQPGLDLFHFTGPTPTHRQALLDVANATVKILGDPATGWPAPIRKAVTFDARAWAKEISVPAGDLAKEVKAGGEKKTGVKDATAEKHAVMAESDHVFIRSAELLEALLRVAGEDERADQVRPSHHKPGVTQQQAPQSVAKAKG